MADHLNDSNSSSSQDDFRDEHPIAAHGESANSEPGLDATEDEADAARKIQQQLESLSVQKETAAGPKQSTAIEHGKRSEQGVVRMSRRIISEKSLPSSRSDGDSRRLSRGRPKSPYKCTFCDEYLKLEPYEGLEVLRLLCLVQRFQCPHCFTRFLRPFAKLGQLGLVRRFFTFDREMLSAPSIVELHQADCRNSFGKRVARAGQWIERLERRSMKALGAMMLGIGRFLTRPFGGTRAKSGGKRTSRSAKPLRDPNRRSGVLWNTLRWLAGSRDR